MVGFCLLDCLVWSAGIRALLFLLYLDCPRRLRLNQLGLRLLVHKYKILRVPSISRVLVDTRCTCEVAAPCNCDVASTYTTVRELLPYRLLETVRGSMLSRMPLLRTTVRELFTMLGTYGHGWKQVANVSIGYLFAGWLKTTLVLLLS